MSAVLYREFWRLFLPSRSILCGTRPRVKYSRDAAPIATMTPQCKNAVVQRISENSPLSLEAVSKLLVRRAAPREISGNSLYGHRQSVPHDPAATFRVSKAIDNWLVLQGEVSIPSAHCFVTLRVSLPSHTPALIALAGPAFCVDREPAAEICTGR